jgi:hypothetical protein
VAALPQFTTEKSLREQVFQILDLICIQKRYDLKGSAIS